MQNQTLKVMKIVWSALMVSLLLYVFISFMVLAKGQPLNLETLADFSYPLRIPFIATAMMSLAMSVILPKILLVALTKRRMSKKPIEFAEMTRLHFAPFVIRLALLESITLYGFVLVAMKQDALQILPFVAVSIAGFMQNFPSEAKVRTTFSRLG